MLEDSQKFWKSIFSNFLAPQAAPRRRDDGVENTLCSHDMKSVILLKYMFPAAAEECMCGTCGAMQ